MNSMARPVVSFMLAVMVGISPMARELCAVLCAESLTASGSTHDHHGSEHSTPARDTSRHHMSAHHTDGHSQTPLAGRKSIAARSDGQRLPCRMLGPSIGSPSACIHLGEWQVSSTPVVKQALDPPVPLPPVVEGVGPPDPVTSRPWVASAASPPIPLARRTPLRV